MSIASCEPSVMFHHFCDSNHPRGQGAIDAEELAQLIKWLGRDRILRADEWIDHIRIGKSTENKICFTFDDALACQYDVAAPVLEAHNLTGFFFIYTGYLFDDLLPRLEIYRYFRTVYFQTVDEFYQDFFDAVDKPGGAAAREWMARFDRKNYPAYPPYYSDNDVRFQQMRDEFLGEQRYFAIMDDMISARGLSPLELATKTMMSAAQIKALADRGHNIGLHSHSHPTVFAALSAEGQAEEYQRNVAAVTRASGRAPIAMSHPCNSYVPATLTILDELGIEFGFRADVTQKNYSRLELPREDHSTLMREMRA